MPDPGTAAETRYRNRATGRLESERVFGHDALELLYGSPGGRLLGRLLASNPVASRWYGWLQRRPSSRHKITRFVRSLGVDAEEAEHPPDDYDSLDAFFTRRLKPGSRPIDPDPD